MKIVYEVDKETVYYDVNTLSWKFIKENDGWWSIYRWHVFRSEWIPQLKSKDLENCKSYDYMTEPKVVQVHQ